MSAIDFFDWEAAGYTIKRLPYDLPHDHGRTPVQTLISATNDQWTNPSSGGLWGRQIAEELGALLGLSPESASRRWRRWLTHYPELFDFVRQAWGLKATNVNSLAAIVPIIEAHVAEVHRQQLPGAGGTGRLFRVVGPVGSDDPVY